ncbi:NEDD4-binding protein 2 isoform X2 [Tiliqua scincoides]|uniref:NEDD4-binding protein 2 isoform X2 n=1 Tax=Tiliqua scincoides TaxID=71010 RepID=UPI003462230A
MPKKKKNLGVSPSRKTINSESIAAAAAGVLPSPVDLAMSQPSHGVSKEELFSSLSEMFSDLDPTVVYMVLSECDFRVEDTMDYLLELSTAAKGVTFSSGISGFDSISASLVGENQPTSVANEIEGQSSAALKFVKSNEELATSLSSEKLIYLLQNSSEKHNLNSELRDSKNDHISGSRFNLAPFENVNPMPAETGQYFSMLQKHSQEPTWNLMAPSFYPQSTNHSFVTPVAVNPAKWSPASNYKSFANVCSPQAITQPRDSNSSLQKTWGKKDGNQKLNLSQVHQLPVCRMMRRKTPLLGHVLVLLRGVPGSGKSYLARTLLEDNPSGIILSTDDYFYQKNGQYQFDADCLGEAHEWNWKRAKEAFEKRITPIIIDNTNIQAWEMKPYVSLSQQHKYKVIFREPDTWWKFKPKELERRNIHGVSKEKIKRMLERYERCLTVHSVLNSSIPDELKSASCDEVLHEEKGQGEEHESSYYGDSEEPFVSTEPLKHIELSIDKSLLDIVAQEDQSLQNEKTEVGYKLLEYNSECSVPVGDLDMYTSPKKGTVNPVLVTQLIKTGLMESEESAHSCKHISENVQEYYNQDLEVQVDVNQCDKVLKEAELTERDHKNVVDSDFEKSERLNFVGDWPIEQTMGQRVKRARRLEKLTIKNDDKDDRCIKMPPLDSLKILDENEKLDLTDSHKELPLYKNKQEENNQSSVCTASVDKDEDTSGLLMLGDWPIQDSLEQRQHKAKRMPKRSISESEATGNNQCDNKNVLSTVAVLPETSLSTRTPCVSSKEESFQGAEISASEILCEKKPMQNKRTRKHHKLALTFTNNLVLSKPQDHLSLFNFLEEKHEACSSAEASKCSQTEPQDFALLWRLERKIIVSEGTKVLHGRLDGFIPKGVDDTSACPKRVPFKVTYDKSTYVEESELVCVDELENLNILCKLFGSFSFDALKDLYERCNRDIDWATGILLDSAEKICKDDDDGCLQDAGAHSLGKTLDFKTNANFKEKLADSEETTQVPGTSAVIQGSEIMNFSVDGGGDKSLDCSLSEITNLLVTASPVPSVENENFSHNVQKTHVEELDSEELLLNTMKKQTKEITPVQNMTLHSEIDSHIPVTVSSYSNEGPTTLKPTFDEDLSNSPSEKLQEWSEIEDTGAQELLADPVLLDYSVSKESKFETSNCKPAFSIAAENVNGKMSNQDDDRTKLLNSKPTSKSVNIDCLELILPPELAIQLSEIFGPVGVDSGSLSTEDYVVHIDLNLAKEIHEKWKASIVKRQRTEEKLDELLLEDPTLFEQLCLDDLDSALSQRTNCQEQMTARLPTHTLAENSRTSNIFPFMDHWNAQTQKVSLRAIMSEEIALQEKELKRPFVARKDCAAKLKEKQLLELFPTIHPNFLIDIFKDYNYSLEQTVQFLNSVLEADPVQTVVAKETTQGASLPNSASKTREKKAKKSKEPEEMFSEKMFQDFEYPEYDDFRAEAFLHQKHKQECLRKAGEAYRMGMKPVAAFYVQQGRLHEQKMKEANHDAAVQIFEKVNASLLPENVLDLHGLHVDEALDHLCRVLHEKTEEYNQAGGKPYLCVITGKGNHSQGRVARIKPAVMKYLTSHKFRFTEVQSGCLKVMLK